MLSTGLHLASESTGRGEVGVNIIKRVFIEERVRDSAKESA